MIYVFFLNFLKCLDLLDHQHLFKLNVSDGGNTLIRDISIAKQEIKNKEENHNKNVEAIWVKGDIKSISKMLEQLHNNLIFGSGKLIQTWEEADQDFLKKANESLNRIKKDYKKYFINNISNKEKNDAISFLDNEIQRTYKRQVQFYDIYLDNVKKFLRNKMHKVIDGDKTLDKEEANAYKSILEVILDITAKEITSFEGRKKYVDRVNKQFKIALKKDTKNNKNNKNIKDKKENKDNKENKNIRDNTQESHLIIDTNTDVSIIKSTKTIKSNQEGKSKKFKITMIVLGLLIGIIFLFGIGYFFYKKKDKNDNQKIIQYEMAETKIHEI
ncbi:hypothetical protein EHP00_1906 [Ecytonucleospora hepatopenaei]|uniref:Uncharacterized protein n=1 Tax=Ecytonucleospora hepatopenaei TaxID=646526 RepID=A0A1W0E3H9_9MICR|nr:hypothetical protein EHP00_1906 [Ecytonucleospora hepatopenaei]